MNKKIISVGDVKCGVKDLFLIAGPCVVEEESLMMHAAEKVKKIAGNLNLSLIFKSSFQKDNRSSVKHYQGPGMTIGLNILKKIQFMH